jgi:hypothetical protein
MDVVQRVWLLVPWIHDAMSCCQHNVRGNQCPGAPTSHSIAADVDLPNGVPGRALLVDNHPVVIADYAGVQILA